jgi:hypothetical protein|tara:strand:+ start:587 stop:790 length:204 start_codon:yes stop_codon:yes gene_type:complete
MAGDLARDGNICVAAVQLAEIGSQHFVCLSCRNLNVLATAVPEMPAEGEHGVACVIVMRISPLPIQD